jgi:flagellar hook-associated protein 3 FlgL
MRISSTQFFQTGVNAMNTQQADLMHLYQQIGSGQRMVTPADDPLAASQAINLGQSQSLNQRYAENRQVVQRNLGFAENTLSDTTLLLQGVKTRLVEASNGTLSDTDRSTLAAVLKDSRDALLGLANARDGSGQYLFSGAKGDTPAYQDINGKVEYKGDQGQRKVQADATRQISASDVGTDIFERASPGTSLYLTRAGNNLGTGTIGSPSITDPSGANVGKTFAIRFTSDTGYVIDATDANGTLETLEQAPGVSFPYDPATASQIEIPGGVLVKFEGAPQTGDTFYVEPATTPDVVASATLQDPASTLSVGSARVTNYSVAHSDYIYAVQFTSDSTYNVTVTSSSDSTFSEPFNNQTFVPGRENTLSLPYGMELKLGGTPVTGDTVQVKSVDDGFKTNLNIFDTLDAAIKALETPSDGDPRQAAELANTLATAMQRVDVTHNNVLTVRASVGARMNELDAMDANGQQRSLGYSKELSRLEDLDYYTATTQLQLRSSALQAASMAFQKIQSLSLFNMGS